jgi:hypothetical protein
MFLTKYRGMWRKMEHLENSNLSLAIEIDHPVHPSSSVIYTFLLAQLWTFICNSLTGLLFTFSKLLLF